MICRGTTGAFFITEDDYIIIHHGRNQSDGGRREPYQICRHHTETIADAAKGSWWHRHRQASPEYVATKMKEAKAVIALQGEKYSLDSATSRLQATSTMSPPGTDCPPRLPRKGVAKRIKNLTFTLARVRWLPCQDLSLTSGSRSDEDEHAAGIPSRPSTTSPTTRASARLRGMHQQRHPPPHQPPLPHLYLAMLLRSGRATACMYTRICARAHLPNRRK